MYEELKLLAFLQTETEMKIRGFNVQHELKSTYSETVQILPWPNIDLPQTSHAPCHGDVSVMVILL